MKIIVTGVHGLVGRAVVAQCGDAGDSVVALGREDLDITDEAAVNRIILTEKPDSLINCAAFTDVDGAESQEELCYLVNSEGVRNLATACLQAGSRFLTISTDYVFDGTKEGFYTEDDAALPLGVYGKAKLAGEKAAADANRQSVIVRTGWIFGSGGTNFLSVIKDLLLSKKQINAIGDQFGTPTYAGDLAIRLRELALLDQPGLFHAANSGDGTSYAGFALETARLLGLESGLVTHVLGSSLERPAPRPVNSRLATVNSSKVGLPEMPDWSDALARYLS